MAWPSSWRSCCSPGKARIVVLRGAGEDFCIGRETMGKRPPARRRRPSCAAATTWCSTATRSAAARSPCVWCAGRAFGRCAIAAVCDITLAADTATFQVPEMAHNIMPTMVMSALVDRAPRKALTYLVWSTARSAAQRARPASSEVFPAAELDAAVEALRAADHAPRPARVGCKDYARAALDMDVTGALNTPAAFTR